MSEPTTTKEIVENWRKAMSEEGCPLHDQWEVPKCTCKGREEGWKDLREKLNAANAEISRLEELASEQHIRLYALEQERRKAQELADKRAR